MANYKIVNRRRKMRYSSITGENPTIPETGTTSDDYPDSSWSNTDIMVGETFMNTADDRVWFRSDNGIYELGYSGQTGTFTGLSDTPNSLTPGAWLIVGSGNTLTESSGFTDTNSITTQSDFLTTGLTSGNTDQYIQYDYNLSGFSLVDCNNSFLGLNDTPTDYTNIGGLFKVNTGQTGLEEFVGTDYYVDLTTEQNIDANKVFNSGATFNYGININYPIIFSGATETHTINGILTTTGLTGYNQNTLVTSEAMVGYIDQYFFNSASTSFVTTNTIQNINAEKSFTDETIFNSGVTINSGLTINTNLKTTEDIHYDLNSVIYWSNDVSSPSDGDYRQYIDVSGDMVFEKYDAVSGWTFRMSI